LLTQIYVTLFMVGSNFTYFLKKKFGIRLRWYDFDPVKLKQSYIEAGHETF